MNYNLNSGYGAALATALHGQVPVTGKLRIVGDSGTANLDMIKEMFVPDPDGGVRFYSTLDAAVSACTANAGDVILVAPGHAEAVTASSITLDVAGVTIINLGNGDNAPTYTFGAAAATINVSADGIKFIGGKLVGNFDNVAAAFTVAGTNFELDSVKAVDTSASLHFLSIVVTSATDNLADGLKVTNCEWRGLALAPNAFISILAAESGVRIMNNRVNMLATNDVGHFLTLAAKVVSDIAVEGNRLIVVGATDAAVGIFMTGSSTTNTGYLADNYVTSLDTTSELITTAALNLGMFNNYYTGNKTASGKLWPAVDAA